MRGTPGAAGKELLPQPSRAELPVPCWKLLLHKTSHLLESLNLSSDHAVYGREGDRLLVGTAVLRWLLIQSQSMEGSWGWLSIAEHPALRWLRPCSGTKQTFRRALSRQPLLQGRDFQAASALFSFICAAASTKPVWKGVCEHFAVYLRHRVAMDSWHLPAKYRQHAKGWPGDSVGEGRDL